MLKMGMKNRSDYRLGSALVCRKIHATWVCFHRDRILETDYHLLPLKLHASVKDFVFGA